MPYARIRSHRSATKLQRALGHELAWFYTFDTAGTLVKLTETELQIARQLPGVTRYTGAAEPSPCWSM